ncbi:MAG: hypothetical protein B6U73_03255 [Desulfurococcales archaeon ex4484_204]|nr:MAG: hypothetical protein B6U73_03255 [Desulfurococcales archaeon ex4484_204]
MPYAAVRLDGVTRRYVPPEYPAVAHPKVFNALLNASRALGIKPLVGIVASDDMFYAGIGELKYW